MSLNSADGKLRIAAKGTASTTAGLSSGSWYLITGKNSTSTGPLPSNLKVNDPFYQRTSASPVTTVAFATGDEVTPLTFTTLAFVTGLDENVTKEKFDETVQTDDVKSYIVSSKPEWTLTVNGYIIDNDAKQQLLLKSLDTVQEHTTSGGITRTSPQTTAALLFLARNEGDTSASAHHYEYRPTIIEGAQMGKPMEGVQPFTLNGTVQGSLNPQTIIVDQ
jgi:hypothetical protein